jgi:UDP-glucose 4-epimerase
MKCVVLGAGGFMGLHLCRALLAAGHEVRAFDKPDSLFLEEVGRLGAEPFAGRFLSSSQVSHALASQDTVFHLMSTTVPATSQADPAGDLESNVLGTVRMLDEALRSGVRRIIFASSGGTVYGVADGKNFTENSPTRPITAYGTGKLAIENYLELYRRLHGMEYVILRIANAYGERQPPSDVHGVVARFLQNAIRGQELRVFGDGSAMRDFVHVEDVIRAFLAALSHDGEKRLFNIGTERGTSLNQLIDIIEQVVGHSLPRQYLPPRAFDVPWNVLDASLARAQLDWQPQVDLLDGIGRTHRSMLNEEPNRAPHRGVP